MEKLNKDISEKKKPVRLKPKLKISSSRAATTPREERESHHIFSLAPTISKKELLDDDGKSDRRFRQLLYDFSVLAGHLEYARAHLASQINITSPQYNIAMTIAYYQGETGVSVSEVAQHLHVTTAFIASEVGKLEKIGLVNKSQNPNDGRGIQLRLTEAGSASLREIGPQRLLINDHLFRGLDGKQFHALSDTLANLIDDFAETINMLKAMRKTRSYLTVGFIAKRKK